jgi:thiamine biosynthesis lipoprotein
MGGQSLEHVMGMPIVVDVRDRVEPAALEPLWAWLRWVDATFSTYNEDSEISRLERRELVLDEADPAVQYVLERCEELRRQTDGHFDSRAGARLDPSGYMKGRAVDCGARSSAHRACATSRSTPAAISGSRAAGCRISSGAWESNIRANTTAVQLSLPYATGPSPRRARTPAAITSSTHTRDVRPRTSFR